MQNTKILEFVKTAIEISFYESPLDIGLTHKELIEILSRADFYEGEINDSISTLLNQGRLFRKPKSDKLKLDRQGLLSFMFMPMTWDEDPRNEKAIDYVQDYFIDLARKYGQKKAIVDRSVLVEIGKNTGFNEKDLNVAINWLSMNEILADNDSTLTYQAYGSQYIKYSEMQSQGKIRNGNRPEYTLLKPIVEDIISRRNDGRLPASDPMRVFPSVIESLGYTNFGLWWKQLISELNQCNSETQPTTVIIISAALCEGALSFIFHKAKEGSQSMVKKIDDNPKNWKFQNLILSGCTGTNPVINDEKLRNQLLDLNEKRQRIHAGRLIHEFGQLSQIPDLNPDIANESKQVLVKLLRRILGWIDSIKQL